MEGRSEDSIEHFAIDILKAPQISEFDFFYSNDISTQFIPFRLISSLSKSELKPGILHFYGSQIL